MKKSNFRNRKKKASDIRLFEWKSYAAGILTALALVLLIVLLIMPGTSAVNLGDDNDQNVFFEEEEKLVADTGSDISGDKELDDEKTIVIGVPQNRIPTFFTNPETGELEGIGIDLARIAAINSGLNARFKVIKEDNLKEALDNREYDVLMPFAGPTQSPSGKNIRISRSIVATPFSLVTLKGDNARDLNEIRVGMLKSLTTAAEIVEKKFPGMEIVFFDNMEDEVKALRKNKVDALLNNSYVWIYNLQKPSYGDLNMLPFSAFSMDFCMGTLDTEEGNALIDRLNTGIEKISEGQIQSIILNYTSQNLYRYNLMDILYVNRLNITIALIVIIFLMVLSVVWWHQRRRYILSLEKKNAQLEEANVRLELAAQDRINFLSSMSHDMRTPLNGIIGFLRFASETDDDSKKNGYIEKARTSANLMLNLISDVLDISKAVSSKMTLKPENFNPRELFKSVVDCVKPQAKKHNIKIESDLANDMPEYIFADKLRMQQIAMNLLANAVKYTPDNGRVEFSLKRLNKNTDGYNTVIRVKDSGIGMAKEFIPRMFDPFAQEHSSRGYGVQGTGLGLAIVKQIVDLMNGSIVVNSEIDHGTEIIIYLPVQDSTIENDTSARNPSDDNEEALKLVRNKRVLLAEDNDLNAEIACTLLKERFKMEVDLASDGKIALDMFAASEINYYNVILMDLRMPVMNGIDSTRAIRALQRPDAEEVPIIAMTADSFSEDVERCLDAGMDDHISKPIIWGNLLETLHKYLKSE